MQYIIAFIFVEVKDKMNYEFTETQKNTIIKHWGNDFYSKILRDVDIYIRKNGDCLILSL